MNCDRCCHYYGVCMPPTGPLKKQFCIVMHRYEQSLDSFIKQKHPTGTAAVAAHIACGAVLSLVDGPKAQSTQQLAGLPLHTALRVGLDIAEGLEQVGCPVLMSVQCHINPPTYPHKCPSGCC